MNGNVLSQVVKGNKSLMPQTYAKAEREIKSIFQNIKSEKIGDVFGRRMHNIFKVVAIEAEKNQELIMKKYPKIRSVFKSLNIDEPSTRKKIAIATGVFLAVLFAELIITLQLAIIFRSATIIRISLFTIHPVLEESGKLFCEVNYKAGFIFTHMVNIFEFTGYVSKMVRKGGNVYKAMLLRAAAAGMHYATMTIQKIVLKIWSDEPRKAQSLALLLGSLVHGLWNYFALVYKVKLDIWMRS